MKEFSIISKVAEPPGSTPTAVTGDRRAAKRLAVHWRVRLIGPIGGKSVESTTENLSRCGFYCVSWKKFKLGERIRCEITIPDAILGSSAPVVLKCQVTVRRTESLQPGFGLGCQIEQYTVGGPQGARLP